MRVAALLLFLGYSVTSSGIVSFDKYFTEKSLRFDYMFAGNSEKTVVYPVGMKQEPCPFN